MNSDEYVDQHEVHVEEECLKMLALHQPVAVDLRRIATVMKVNNDLERIADLAVSIAQRAKAMRRVSRFPDPRPRCRRWWCWRRRWSAARWMPSSTLDTAAARRIIAMDNAVDRYNRDIIDELQTTDARRGPRPSPPACIVSPPSRHIERIADHATNIAEDVIYLVEGDIVRHRHDREVSAESPPK